jgi:hypothetical protein
MQGIQVLAVIYLDVLISLIYVDRIGMNLELVYVRFAESSNRF